IENKYHIKVDPYFPDTASVEKIIREHGPNLFYKSVELRRLCCRVRKVEPLHRALSELDAWITGLRRNQAVTRAEIKKIEYDRGNDLVKINPIADWDEDQVWEYIKANQVPYNALHDRNYPSIGCEPCTRAVKPGEDIRAGRWWWESPEKKECGLHK
ncbi:MAG: phosphoadenylyl-sulfate reductase, partial [Candidatus Margulisiibacteriota bacterium]